MRFVGVAIAACLASIGCFGSDTQRCADGRLCPQGSVCDDAHDQCVDPDQLSACDGLFDGDDCLFSQTLGRCDSGVCIAAACGDGFLDPGELCDGAPPAGVCTQLGYDFGALTCSAECTTGFDTCGRIGWNLLLESENLQATWAVADDDLWALENTSGLVTMYHFDGETWSVENAPAPFYDMVAASDGTLFGRDQGEVWRLESDGSWTNLSGPGLGLIMAMWPATGDDVFVVAQNGTIARYSAGTWTELPSGTAQQLYGIFGFSASDVFAVGSGGTALHYDGQQWAPQQVPPSSLGQARILRAVWGRSPSDVYAVGDIGYVGHYDGSQWSRVAELPVSLTSVTGNSRGTFIAGGFSIFFGELDSWTPTVTDARSSVYRLHATPDSDVVFARSQHEVFEFSGSAWAEEVSAATIFSFDSVWGSAGDDIWAASRNASSAGTVWHFDGADWTQVTIGTTDNLVINVAGCAADDILAVVLGDEIIEYDGISWSAAPQPATLVGVVCIAGEAFAVGVDGAIAHRVDGVWSAQPSATDLGLWAVWAADVDDVFAVGLAGTIVHYDGTAWSAMETPTDLELLDVFGTADDDVYAVGALGTILHYDGDRWTAMESGSMARLTTVFGAANDLFAVGREVLHFDGAVWTPVNVSQFDKYFLTGDVIGERPFFVGESGTAVGLVRTVPW